MKWKELSSDAPGESSAEIRKRVIAAREIQSKRFREIPGIYANAHMDPAAIGRYCRTDEEGARLLQMAVERLGLSARAYHRVLKVARTIADLVGEEAITPSHMAKAIQYRQLDRPVGRR